MEDRGFAVLKPGTPLDQLMKEANQPCSALSAGWGLSLLGKIPREPRDWGEWDKRDKRFWREVNLWKNYGDRRWENLRAFERAFPGSSYEIVRGTSKSNRAPGLTKGRWHLGQSWCGGDGHSKLIWRGLDGKVGVVETDQEKGLRRYPDETWYRLGCDIGVLTMPPLGGKESTALQFPRSSAGFQEWKQDVREVADKKKISGSGGSSMILLLGALTAGAIIFRPKD